MENTYKKEDLIFTDTSDNTDNKAVLGILEGPCADIIEQTRNGRHYSEALWEKTFSDPIVTEMIENGGIPGELDHPVDRTEIDSSRIAILLKEKPEKKNGKLWAKFSILNTPLGKIAHTLAKAGFKLGVSSRGQGDTYINSNGQEEVDEASYEFKCFDLVLLPSVKAARLNLVTESLQNNFDYKKALTEALATASTEDRQLMESVLSDLNISYQSGQDSVDNIEEVSESHEVDNNESLVNALQEALIKVKDLENRIINLQEKLSVSYTKEAQQEDQLDRYKKAILKLSKNSEKLTAVNSLNEKLNKDLVNTKSKLEKCRRDYVQALEATKNQIKTSSNLQEDLITKKKQYSECLQNLSEQKEKNIEMEQKFENLSMDFQIKKAEYSKNLENANMLVEKYKKIAQNAVDRYIRSQAIRLGVNSNEIKNKLSENYTFDDIDKVCKDVQTYKLNMAKLPFNTSLQLNENIQMKVKQDNGQKQLMAVSTNIEDDIDSQLLGLAKIT